MEEMINVGDVVVCVDPSGSGRIHKGARYVVVSSEYGLVGLKEVVHGAPLFFCWRFKVVDCEE